MVSTRVYHAALAICMTLLASHQVSSQNVLPINDTSNLNLTTHYTLNTILSMTPYHAETIPLTDGAGLQRSFNDDKDIEPQGHLVTVDTESFASLKPQDIAYISCEPADYDGGALSATQLIEDVANAKPNAIVFYSVYATQCSFNATNDFSYQSLYSMISANDSATLISGLRKNDPNGPNSSLVLNQSSYNPNGSGNNNGANGNVLGKSPTTAVAMIILYSITGIITALFLAIIIVGAIRAHRHPERYGPRRVMGRPRQSRAKGIARAMLETLPIVKFGDKEEEKTVQVPRDIELADTTQANGSNGAEDTRRLSGGHVTDSATIPVTEKATGDGPDVVTTEAAGGEVPSRQESTDPANAAENGLACAVCIADFVKGQDTRVLPCKHKFHPECIDPWLLNVSGTCPLCRVDLHPTTSHDSEEMEYDEGPTLDTREAPNVEVSARRHRRSRILHTLNIGRMRHATPEERLEALRRLREENQAASDSTAEQGGRIGNRFRRISRAFGSRPASGIGTSRPVSEIPPQAAELPHPAAQEITETTPHAVTRISPAPAVTDTVPISTSTTEPSTEPSTR